VLTAIHGLSKIDHPRILEPGYIRIMAPNTLTREEFASLLKVGNCSTLDPPAAIPVEPAPN